MYISALCTATLFRKECERRNEAARDLEQLNGAA
jgi:hypothetical protein